MSNRLGGGARGINYIGTLATQPPECHFEDRNPTNYDTNGYSLLDLWLNKTNNYVFILVSLEGTSTSRGQLATWIQIYPIAGLDLTFITDNGKANPLAGVIDFQEAAQGQGTATFQAPGTSNLVAINFTDANNNTGLGKSTLSANSGSYNSAYGSGALQSNGASSSSSAFGYDALNAFASSSAFNDAFGYQSQLKTSSGGGNCSFGAQSLSSITTSSFSSAFGLGSQKNATTGSNDSFGNGSLSSLSGGGTNNLAVGRQSLVSLLTGSNNCCLGASSGSAYTGVESNNVVITSTTSGVTELVGESSSVRIGSTLAGDSTEVSNTIKIGNSSAQFISLGYTSSTIMPSAAGIRIGFIAETMSPTDPFNYILIGALATTGDTTYSPIKIGYTNAGRIYIGATTGVGDTTTIRIGTSQANCYIAGISGKTSTSGSAVYINSSGLLGTTTSSRRYKENIEDIGDASSALMKLRPVSFTYIKDGTKEPQFGLIAEEVEEVFKDLVIYKDNQPETIRYQHLAPLLLNELLKQNKRIGQLEEQLRLALKLSLD